MRTTVHALAEEYFSLTGRPIATMTVAEYIMFKQVESASLMNSGADYPHFKSVPVETHPDVSIPEIVPMSDTASNINIPAVKESSTQSSNEAKTNATVSNIIPLQGDKNTKKNNQLSMLKSISG